MPPSLHALLLLIPLLLLPSGSRTQWQGAQGDQGDQGAEGEPLVLVAVVARNAAHSLPYCLGALERQTYPPRRLAFWLSTDHNEDDTIRVVREWAAGARSVYRSVEVHADDADSPYPGEKGCKHWSRARFQRVLSLRQEALDTARSLGAEFVFLVDADVVLWNPATLGALVGERRAVVGPMLTSRTAYSNYWSGITDKGYYRRTAEYLQLRERRRRGCHRVPMLHSALLLNVGEADAGALAFHPPPPDYSWPYDDVIVFAHSCMRAGVAMHVCNSEEYGHVPVPLKPSQGLQEERASFQHLLLEIMVDQPPPTPSPFISMPPKHADKMGFDEVFLINLRRRPERRARMLHSLGELQIDASVVDGVDGATLSDEALRVMGVAMLPGYWEPYSGRRLLTRGEIGCFLSHHRVWEQVVSRGLSSVLLFEDDCRFEPNFRHRLGLTMAEVSAQGLQWDLIYVGRKRMQVERPEAAVPGVRGLVVPDYSYWTLSYALSLRGAQKLLLAQPLSRMVPVDEFLPVMYDKHPTREYCAPFSPRDLLAFSLEPLLVFPSHYAGQALYVSDTEASALWNDGGGGDGGDRAGSLGSLAGGARGAKGARGARGPGVVGAAASRDEL